MVFKLGQKLRSFVPIMWIIMGIIIWLKVLSRLTINYSHRIMQVINIKTYA